MGMIAAYGLIHENPKASNMGPLDQLNILIFKILIKYSHPGLRAVVARRYGAKIGKGCKIFSVNFGTEPYLVSIGDETEVASNVAFLTHDGGIWVLENQGRFEGTKFGPIIIRENCYIGYSSIILPNVEIGPNSIVGAGSVVTKNVPPNAVYAGNPARFICTLDQYLNKCNIKNTGKIKYKDKKKLLGEIFKNRL